MTRADVTKWWPLILAAGSLVAGWTTVRRDVSESVRIPRYEAESLRTMVRFRDQQREIDALLADRMLLRSICAAVRCK